MELLYLLPIIIAAVITILSAFNNKEELYVKPEISSEQAETDGRLSIKGLLKYSGIFLALTAVLYLLAFLAPIIIFIFIIGAFLSSFSFFFVFRF